MVFSGIGYHFIRVKSDVQFQKIKVIKQTKPPVPRRNRQKSGEYGKIATPGKAGIFVLPTIKASQSGGQ